MKNQESRRFKSWFISEASDESLGDGSGLVATSSDSTNLISFIENDKINLANNLLKDFYFEKSDLIKALNKAFEKATFRRDCNKEIIFNLMYKIESQGEKLSEEKLSDLLDWFIGVNGYRVHSSAKEDIKEICELLIKKGAKIPEMNYGHVNIDGDLGYTGSSFDVLDMLGLIDRKEFKANSDKFRTLENWAVQELEKGRSIEEIKNLIEKSGWPESKVKILIEKLKFHRFVIWVKNEIKNKKPLKDIKAAGAQAGWDKWTIKRAIFYEAISDKDREAIKKLIKWIVSETKNGHSLNSLISLIKKSGHYGDFIIEFVADPDYNSMGISGTL
jgi:hypothetical protein